MLLNTGRTPDFDSFIRKQDMRPIPIPRKAYKAEKIWLLRAAELF